MIRRPPSSTLFPTRRSSDLTAELYENRLSVFGGPYSEWRAWLDAEQDAARNAERAAAQVVKREKRSEEHTSELQSQSNLVCRLLLEKKKKKKNTNHQHNNKL